MCGTIALRPSVAPGAGQAHIISSEIDLFPSSVISH